MEKTGVVAGVALAAAGLFLLTRKKVEPPPEVKPPPEKPPEVIPRRTVCMYGKVYQYRQKVKAPLPGAIIHLTYPEDKTVISGKDGNYKLCFQVEIGDWTEHFEITVSAGGCETASGWGYVPEEDFEYDLGLECRY